MIETTGITKRFEDVTALDHISVTLKDRSVFGLVGTNGAGKSTFLRILAGILRPDKGVVLIDRENIWENPERKKEFFYISDEPYLLPAATPEDMARFYSRVYTAFDKERLFRLMENFGLDRRRKLSGFSKGMKKQFFLLCGVSSGTRYLFFDETFDGLDPVMRQAAKTLLAGEMEERGLTPIIASHSLRELEDICDHVGLLHQGGILFSRDLDDMKLGIHKVQCILSKETPADSLKDLDIVLRQSTGSVETLIVRGDREEILAKVRAAAPLFCELLPLTLEEIFICETEVKGYDIKKLLL